MKSRKNILVMPIVKWVGGKRQLLNELIPLLPKKISTYCEPFVGGGALFFNQQPKSAYINDINKELIELYETVRDDVEYLITILKDFKNEPDFFYSIRDWDRNNKEYLLRSKVERAARIVYLNKTCYNGLFRVNNAGEFNTPFGYYKNPNIVNAPVLKAVNLYFNNADIKFTHMNYLEVCESLPRESFVYLDPPYDPISDTSNFTGYSKGGFNKEEQTKLKECCDTLNKRKIKFMLSNSATTFIQELYSEYNITIIQAKRAINSVSTKRGDVNEVVVRNYE